MARTSPAMKTIRSASTLEQLRDMLRGPTGEALTEQEWTALPTLGGEEPSDTHEVWSWDATRLLVGTCAADLRIVARDEWRRPKSARRSGAVLVLLTPEEREEIRAAAEREGLALGSWLRSLALRAARATRS